MIRKPAHKNTVDPPGQIKNDVTLGDYIERKQKAAGFATKEECVPEEEVIYINLNINQLDDGWFDSHEEARRWAVEPRSDVYTLKLRLIDDKLIAVEMME